MAKNWLIQIRCDADLAARFREFKAAGRFASYAEALDWLLGQHPLDSIRERQRKVEFI